MLFSEELQIIDRNTIIYMIIERSKHLNATKKQLAAAERELTDLNNRLTIAKKELACSDNIDEKMRCAILKNIQSLNRETVICMLEEMQQEIDDLNNQLSNTNAFISDVRRELNDTFNLMYNDEA